MKEKIKNLIIEALQTNHLTEATQLFDALKGMLGVNENVKVMETEQTFYDEAGPKTVVLSTLQGQVVLVNVPNHYTAKQAEDLGKLRLMKHLQARGIDVRELSFHCFNYQENPTIFKNFSEKLYFNQPVTNFVVLNEDCLVVDFEAQC